MSLTFGCNVEGGNKIPGFEAPDEISRIKDANSQEREREDKERTHGFCEECPQIEMFSRQSCMTRRHTQTQKKFKLEHFLNEDGSVREGPARSLTLD
jgi:hypothetical protein